MPTSFRFRLLILAAAMFALVAVVAVLAHLTWTQSVAVRAQFRMVQGESLQLSEHIRAAVQSLDTNLLQFKIGRDPRDWREFNDDAAELQHWLGEQRSALQTSGESQLLLTIGAELTAYLADARVFASIGDEPFAGGKIAETLPANSAVTEQLAALDRRSAKLLGLGFDLAEAHNATLDNVLASADRAIGRIEWSTFIALALLLAAGSGTAWVVFRDSILPLQRQLHDSRLQLERQEKLASLGVLSAGIAHEIRNPLTALKARLFTLRKVITAGSSAAEDVGVINDEVDRLERIVRSFLRFARPPEPNLTSVDPVALLRRVSDLVAPQWNAKGVRLELDETPAPAIEADGDQIEQALINLIQNAAEAMPGGGIVRLRAFAGGALPPGANNRRTAVTLEVADNGPGIPADVQPRLFDPFFTTKSAGTGLGLALTARIVEKHEGRIRFQTEEARGTTFTLVLPGAEA